MLPFYGYSFQGEIDGGGSSLTSRSTDEMKSAAACKSHSEAERRRRERINGHLARLRTLLPNLAKGDKASLLAEVVRHVKELKRRVGDVAAADFHGSSGGIWTMPSETDEVTLDVNPRSSLIKASVCCDDRPGLLSDLNSALRSLRLRAVKAEMATLGGRTKSIFLIERGGGKGEYDDEYQRLSIRRALKAVLNKPAITIAAAAAAASPSSSPTAMLLLGNKRPRLSTPQFIVDIIPSNDDHDLPFTEML